jgi:hypothetical protein
MATLSQLVPNIKIGQVHQSIKQILLHHNHHVAGSRRISQSVAALRAIKEYLTIAELKIPKSILDDTRFCRGKGSAIPNKHCKEFKNAMVAKLLWDAWFGPNRTGNYRCINAMNHYQVHHNFFPRLAEWFILNLNPHGELNLDLILGSNPAESNNSYRKKAK